MMTCDNCSGDGGWEVARFGQSQESFDYYGGECPLRTMAPPRHGNAAMTRTSSALLMVPIPDPALLPRNWRM